MKKLIYQIEGYISVYNPDTKEVEQQLSLATVTVECKTQAEFDEAYSNAKEMAVGEIIVEGEFDEVIEPTAQDDTDAMLVDHEYRLTLLELGVTE